MGDNVFRMPRAVCRLLLVAWLLLALGVQGQVQAAMVTCGMGGAMAQQAGAGAPGHDHAAMLAAMEAAAGASQGNAGPDTPKATPQAKCTHCAPCCVGSALVTEVLIPIAAPVTAQAFPAITVAAPSVDGRRLDRPPRSFPA